MSRIRPFVLFVLLALSFGLVPPPSHALPGTPVPVPIIQCGLERAGAGETAAEALAMALDSLSDNYLIMSYTIIHSHCGFVDPNPLDPDNPLEPFCSVKIKACGIPRLSPFFP